MDTDNFEPVTECHLIVNGQVSAVSDSDGRAMITVIAGDTLKLSCVGYQMLTMVITENDLKLEELILFMDVKKIVLHEITVTDMPTEEEFKRMILNNEIKKNESQVIAERNIKNIQLFAIYGMPPQMGAFENYKNYTKGLQPVVFWSSGNKGLIQSIKDFSSSKQTGQFPIHQPSISNMGFKLWTVPNLPDSVKNTSVEITSDNNK